MSEPHMILDEITVNFNMFSAVMLNRVLCNIDSCLIVTI